MLLMTIKLRQSIGVKLNKTTIESVTQKEITMLLILKILFENHTTVNS